MTKEQADVKLSLMPLTSQVIVSYSPDMEDENQQRLTFTWPGHNVQVPLAPNSTNLADIVAQLPMSTGDRLACVAIMLAPSLPGDEVTPA